jgi:hypothetical protein
MTDDSEPTKQELLNRIEQLENTVATQQQSRSNLKLTRRGLLAAGGVSALGLASVGNVSGQSSGQVGTIGTANDRVDLFVEDLDVSGNTTGVGGGGVVSRTKVRLSSDSSADPVPLDDIIYDPDNAFDTGFNEYQAPSEGVFILNFSYRRSSDASSMQLELGDASVNTENEDSDAIGSATAIQELGNGETITLRNFFNTNLRGFETNTHISITQIA